VISEQLERSLHKIFQEARRRRHEFLTPEHLLLGLLDEPTATDALVACAADVEKLRENLSTFLDEVPTVTDGEKDTEPTKAFVRVIQRAILHVQSSGKKEVTGANALVAVFGEKESPAVHFLHQAGVTRLDVVQYLSYGIKREETAPDAIALDDADLFIEAVEQLPSKSPAEAASEAAARLFISYSHADKPCLDRLLVHLRPLERSKAIMCWSDQNIRTGRKWKDEIEKSLAQASIAILLVSADFLASDFIVNNELPPMLLRAESQGLRILPVVLKPCGFLRDPNLCSFQAANDPRTPLLALGHIEQEALYDKIAAEVMEEIRLRSEHVAEPAQPRRGK
jgi:hypothetical protein